MNPTEPLPAKLYQLTLFYNTLQENKTVVQNFQKVIKDVFDDKYRVISAGSQLCSIGFIAVMEPKRLKQCFKGLCVGESVNFILVEVSGVIAGSLDTTVLQWLDKSPVDYKFWNK